jgi:hypothetical protein
VAKKQNLEQIARYADMLSAMGAEPRLRIMQLLLSAHPQGMVLWYSANTEGLRELLGFLYAECCTRNKAIEPEAIVSCC